MKPLTRGLAIGCTTVVMAAGLQIAGTGPASAHTGNLPVTVVCNKATGQYDFTGKLVLSKVPAGKVGSTMWRIGNATFQGTPSSNAGMDRGPLASTGNATFTLVGTGENEVKLSLPGTTTGFGPWLYAFTQWNDFAVGSDGQSTTRMDGTCKPDAVKDASASLSTTPATCTAPETLVYGGIANATWSGTPDGTQGPGSFNVVATGNPGPPPHVFGDGNPTKVFEGSLADRLDPNDYPECRSVQPPDVTRYDTERGCDLSAFGEGYLPGVIGRTGKESYVWSPELRDWVLSGVVAWDPWFQIATWNHNQQVRHGCTAPDVVKPRGSMTTSCAGQVAWTLDTTNNIGASSVFHLRVHKGQFRWSKDVTLRAGNTRYIVRDVPNGARATLKYRGHTKHARVPGACGNPDTGMKTAPSLLAKQVVRDFSWSRLLGYALR